MMPAPTGKLKFAYQTLQNMEVEIEKLKQQLAEQTLVNQRFQVLAVKWCDKEHHDWEEIQGMFQQLESEA